MSLSPEDINAIAAVVAKLVKPEGAQALPVQPEETADASDLAEIKRSEEERRQQDERANELVKELIPLIMQPRHLEVFKWAAGNAWVAMVTLVLRAEVKRLLPDYREAQGKGGSSSRNLEALSERLTPR